MLNRFSQLIFIFGIIIFSTISVSQVNAQEVDSQSNKKTPVNTDVTLPDSYLDLDTLMNRTFFQESGTIYQQATIGGQLNFLLGWKNFPVGSFPENNILRDALLMNVLRYDYFKQMAESDPIVRTRDLPNPFSSSINDNPSYVRK